MDKTTTLIFMFYMESSIAIKDFNSHITFLWALASFKICSQHFLLNWYLDFNIRVVADVATMDNFSVRV